MLQPLNILYSHTEWDWSEKAAPNLVQRIRLGQVCLGSGMSCLPPASPFQSNILAKNILGH